MVAYPYFGVPPAREHRPAVQEPALAGKRVIMSTPEGFVYDTRAVGDAHTDGMGNVFVDIMTEDLFFQRELLTPCPVPVTWPAHLVWVD